MRQILTKRQLVAVYGSMEEWAEACRNGVQRMPLSDDRSKVANRGGATMAQVFEMARTGWADHLEETLRLAESAIEMMIKAHEIESFTPVYDYSGSDVDIARYLSGDPENMIDYPLMTVSSVGKVVTLVASINKSYRISPDTAIRRGQVMAAFALALSRMGHGCELWADYTSHGYGSAEKHLATARVLIKGTADELDPARILFAYAHPCVSRGLGWAWKFTMPEEWQKGFRAGSEYGVPVNPPEDMGEEPIYLPCLRSDADVPDADVLLRNWLRRVGLLAE